MTSKQPNDRICAQHAPWKSERSVLLEKRFARVRACAKGESSIPARLASRLNFTESFVQKDIAVDHD